MKLKDILIIVVFLGVLVGVWFFIKNAENDNSPLEEKKTDEPMKIDLNQKEEPKAVAPEPDTNNINKDNLNKNMQATINTSEGAFTIEFYEKDAPNTVANFLKLAKSGFYDGVKFHRVIKGFMDQVGDPLSKDDSKMDMWGTGGPGYKFADEINATSALYKTGYKKGVVAMANSGPNTNGSQFFIMAADYPLPPLYTIFGHVVSGLDVIMKINETKTGANDRPINPIEIKSITLK